MKSDNSKLNQSLRDALKDHPEPLSNHQWDRIQASLGERKKRGFPWIFVALLVFVSSMIAFTLGYLTGDRSLASDTQVKQPTLQSPEVGRQQQPNDTSMFNSISDASLPNNTSLNNQVAGPATSSSPAIRPSSSHSAGLADAGTSSRQAPSGNPGRTSSSTSRENPAGSDLAGNPAATQGASAATGPEPTKGGDHTQNAGDTKSKPELNSTALADQTTENKDTLKNQNLISEKSQTNPSNTDLEKDSKTKDNDNAETKSPKKKKQRKSDLSELFNDRLTLGLRFGPSVFKSGVGDFSNTKTVHKDTRDLFENGISDRKSSNIDLMLQFRIVKGLQLGFNTGVQVRTLSEKRTYNYTLKDIPFRDNDSAILFYVTNKDSTNLLKFNSVEQISYRFVSIPLVFNYDFKLGRSSALNTGLGLNLNWVTGLKGQMVNVNEFKYESTSQLIKKRFYTGWNVRLGYSHQLYKRLWAGFDIGLQRNSMKYDLSYSTFKTAFTFTNYNFCLYYKL